MKSMLNAVSGITLIALVVTIVVLLILASVSITVVFGDNGILQLAKEAGDKTNEAVKKDLQDIQSITTDINTLMNNWDTSKVTAVTSADGRTVPVPKGFVGSGASGENTVSGGYVIYEGETPVTDANVAKAREERNQFVWIPANGVSLEYKQDKEAWSTKTYYYNECKEHWTDEEKIEERKASVEKYGGFYVGRYEAGVEESKDYENGSTYQGNGTNRNNTTGTPVTKKGRQAWNNVNQTNSKALSEKMYATSKSVTSRLIDSYAWDTICTWLSNDEINVIDSTSWGNYLNASEYNISGLYAKHTYDKTNGWILAKTYNRTTGEEAFTIPGGRTATDTEENPRECYEIATGISDRNKAKNIYDFAGNMWEWTTETEEHNADTHTTPSYTKNTGTYATFRGGSFYGTGGGYPAASRYDDHIRQLQSQRRFSFRALFEVEESWGKCFQNHLENLVSITD